MPPCMHAGRADPPGGHRVRLGGRTRDRAQGGPEVSDAAQRARSGISSGEELARVSDNW